MKIPIKRTPERSTIGFVKEEILFLKDAVKTIKDKTGADMSWSEFGKYVVMKYAEEAVQDIVFELEDEKK